VRGGRFVAGFDGEQYALPEAVTLLRGLRRKPARPLGGDRFQLSSADPLDFRGVLTPATAPAATRSRRRERCHRKPRLKRACRRRSSCCTTTARSWPSTSRPASP
jgi:hypothetical protein